MSVDDNVEGTTSEVGEGSSLFALREISFAGGGRDGSDNAVIPCILGDSMCPDIDEVVAMYSSRKLLSTNIETHNFEDQRFSNVFNSLQSHVPIFSIYILIALEYSFKIDFAANLSTVIPFPFKAELPQAFGVAVACCEYSVLADAAIESFSFDNR